MKNLTKKDQQHEDFGKKILAIVPCIYPYVKHRLYTAEVSGIIPHNMYKSNEMVDDAIVKLYEDIEGRTMNDKSLKLKLFSLVSQRLDELFKKEAFHKDTVSTSQILKRELHELESNFEMDLDDDLLMPDELDDISYHQNDNKKPAFLYNDAEQNIIQVLDLRDTRIDLSEDKRIILNKIYNWLPFETSNILDLFVFGKLTYEEIAIVKDVSTQEVKKSIQLVSKNLRKNLN